MLFLKRENKIGQVYHGMDTILGVDLGNQSLSSTDKAEVC